MRQVFMILMFLATGIQTAFSCSCVYIPTFCETITYSGGTVDSNYAIVHARVESRNSDEMKVRVLTTLFGTPEGNVLTIPQGYGADCRASIDGFERNSEYLFALYGSTNFLSICGVTSLLVSGKDIVGDIAPGIRRIPISEFPTIENCGGIGSLLAFIDVTPTLTSNAFAIISGQDIENIRIAMYDMMGRKVFAPSIDRLLTAEPLVIQANHFPPGGYTIVVEAAAVRRVFRVVIIS